MMKNRDKKIEEKIERTIGIFDDMENIEADPFLFTRIKAGLEEKENTRENLFFSWLPSPQAALIVTLVVINLFSLIFYLSETGSATKSTDTFVNSFTEEYFLSVDNDILKNLNEID